MKKTKVIIPALGILLLSTAASVTGTVAWFSQNQNVYANDMKVKAKAETGLVISKTGVKTGYDSEVSFADDTIQALFPTSTANFTTWYHNNSKDPGQATGEGNVGTYTTDAAENTHYVEKKVWIRSSSNLTIAKALIVKSVSITSIQNLSNAIRVGIWFRDGAATDKFIYAGDTETTSYAVGGTTTTVNTIALNQASTSAVNPIPSNQDNGTAVSIFIWFEGEDENCISNNIGESLENVSVDVTFSTAA